MHGIDDALDCFGVHARRRHRRRAAHRRVRDQQYGGTAGLIEGNAAQLINQIKGIVIVIVYDAIVSLIILKIIDAVIGLRVTDEVEREGLDIALHGEAVSNRPRSTQASGRGGNPALSLPSRPRFARTGASSLASTPSRRVSAPNAPMVNRVLTSPSLYVSEPLCRGRAPALCISHVHDDRPARAFPQCRHQAVEPARLSCG